MIIDNLKERIERLTEKELTLVKVLIFQYNNFNTSEEMKAGYRNALHHVFHMLDIASLPDIDLRPAGEQQIDKMNDAIKLIEKESKTL